jgi:Holliday junction resolvasome RuvABC endonuclease subunit
MRFDSISTWAMRYLTGLEQICIEGYAYGAKGKIFHIAENTGILKYKIYQLQIPLEIASPSQVKKMATGKGNATKDEMHDAFHKETNVNLIKTITPDRDDVISPVGDIVDSFYVCKYLYLKILNEQ